MPPPSPLTRKRCPVTVAHPPHEHPNIYPCSGITNRDIMIGVETKREQAWVLSQSLRRRGIPVTDGQVRRNYDLWDKVRDKLQTEYERGADNARTEQRT